MIQYEVDYDKIPDWIQAIGALVAAFGLVITLLLQRKTLQEQQQITLLERQKFINSYLPILELNDVWYDKYTDEGIMTFSINIKENYLQKLEIIHNFPDDFNVEIPHVVADVIFAEGYWFKFKIVTKFSKVIVDVIEYSGNTITLTYQDALGNKYVQYIVYKGSTNIFLYPAYKE